MNEFSHLDPEGRARMVDVSEKEETLREALVECFVKMKKETVALIKAKKLEKGDVVSTARTAGVMAAKKTPELIPMCHPLRLSFVGLEFEFVSDDEMRITATVRAREKTGVEMEALTAAAVAALTVYDMCKAVDKGMEIGGLKLLKKTGGKSGTWER